jgi:hypothetical protein
VGDAIAELSTSFSRFPQGSGYRRCAETAHATTAVTRRADARKLQAPNPKLQKSSKPQAPNQASASRLISYGSKVALSLGFGFPWNLVLEASLGFGVWDLELRGRARRHPQCKSKSKRKSKKATIASDASLGDPLHGETRDLPRVLQIQLLFDVSPMGLHRLRAKVQRFCDRFDLFSGADHLKHFQLPVA